MNNFPSTHPNWMWMYFGFFSIIGMVLFILVIWNWMNYYKLTDKAERSIAKWQIFGYMFLFFGQWFACGIGAPPGNLMSSDITTHNLERATLTASLSIFFAVPGWLCILIAQNKMFKSKK